MHYCVYYDISDNKTRKLAIKLCKQAGLVRVQRSVFLGDASPPLIRELCDQMKPLLQAATDSLSIQPLGQEAYNRLRFFGKPVDKTEVARKEPVRFF